MFINKSRHKIRVIDVIRHQNEQVCKRSNYRDRPLQQNPKMANLYTYVITKTSKNLDWV